VVVPVRVDGQLYASAQRDQRSGERIVKVVNPVGEAVRAEIRVLGGSVSGTGRTTLLASGDLADENSLDAPRRVSPVEERVLVEGAVFSYSLRPYSVTALRVLARATGR
jgi:alpha-L-arabinofuranosidase